MACPQILYVWVHKYYIYEYQSTLHGTETIHSSLHIAVSYTHLDVYKRQNMNSLMEFLKKMEENNKKSTESLSQK